MDSYNKTLIKNLYDKVMSAINGQSPVGDLMMCIRKDYSYYRHAYSSSYAECLREIVKTHHGLILREKEVPNSMTVKVLLEIATVMEKYLN